MNNKRSKNFKPLYISSQRVSNNINDKIKRYYQEEE